MKPISDIFTFQETFLSNVNHELQSPLTSLKGNSEVVLRQERSAGEYREALESGLKETDRMINLLHNLSLLVSSEFKPLELSQKRADLDEVLRELVSTYSPVLNAKQISLDITDTHGASCLCDEDLIRRTMENLLDNAVKYTPNGGSITVSLSRKKGKIFFTISNTCEPIEKKELENLLQPFYRGEKSHLQAEGKGLGLYIVSYIVRSHGGDIALDRTDSRVFSVTVSLPA
jgi:signal transduction histidine kinase